MPAFVSEAIGKTELCCFSGGLVLVCCGFPGKVLPCGRDEAVGGSVIPSPELSSLHSNILFSSSSAAWLSTHSGGKRWQGCDPSPTPCLQQVGIPGREGGKFRVPCLSDSRGSRRRKGRSACLLCRTCLSLGLWEGVVGTGKPP